MPIEDGHFTGGPVTVLKIAPQRLDAVEPFGKLYLNDEEKEVLRKATGIGPSFLWLYDLRKGETDCTCDAVNRGLRISTDEVEVPHEYLMTDEDLEKIIDSIENM